MEYAKEERGRCISCGFLSRRVLVPEVLKPTYYEVNERDRRQGLVLTLGETRVDMACYRGEYPLQMEYIQELVKIDNRKEAISYVLGKRRGRRGCARWFGYVPDMGPPEHLQEVRVAQLQKTARRQLWTGALAALAALGAVVGTLLVAFYADTTVNVEVMVPTPAVEALRTPAANGGGTP